MAIRRDAQTISVAYVDGCTLYSHWNDKQHVAVHECPYAVLEAATKQIGSKSENGAWALRWLQGYERKTRDE